MPTLFRRFPTGRLSDSIRAARTLLQLGWFCGFLSAVPAMAAEEAFSSRALAPDPEWQGVAGARAATGMELSAGLGNPAATANLDAPGAAFSHLSWAAGLAREWAAIGGPIAGPVAGMVDGGVLRSSSLEGFDASGNSTGSFSVSEWNLGACLATRLGSGFQLGVGARTFHLSDPIAPLEGLGFSAGLAYRLGGTSLGISITDQGRNVGDAGYRLPTRWHAGIEVSPGLRRWLVAVAADGNPSGEQALHAGGILRPFAWLDLQGGATIKADQGIGATPSAGVSLRQGSFTFQYAYCRAGELGSTQQFGLRLALRKSGSVKAM